MPDPPQFETTNDECHCDDNDYDHHLFLEDSPAQLSCVLHQPDSRGLVGGILEPQVDAAVGIELHAHHLQDIAAPRKPRQGREAWPVAWPVAGDRVSAGPVAWPVAAWPVAVAAEGSLPSACGARGAPRTDMLGLGPGGP